MANKTVMIVDDNLELLEELQTTLTLSGYDMVAVNDPVSSLSLAKKTKPDVVVIDLKMPGMSGFELAKEMRRYLKLQRIPVIAMSGFFEDECALLMHLCGIKRYLRKPFQPLNLISAIEESLK
ncbi:MAG: response regulator [Candidatus Omnitrophica bacterium]|nr:response regulator [Candidatus Omnitrophota bacterium]MBU4478617.1 response regulator [Candidatus Omnitrophota bacterium]